MFAVIFFMCHQFKLRMCELRFSLVEGHASIKEIYLARNKRFFNPADTLEPYQFKRSGSIFYHCNQSPRSFIAGHINAYHSSIHLYVIGKRMDVFDQVDDGLVDMPEWKMFQQITKSMNTEFFFQ